MKKKSWVIFFILAGLICMLPALDNTRFIEKGVDYLRHDYYPEAKEQLLRSISEKEDIVVAHYYLGLTLLGLRDFEGAYKEFKIYTETSYDANVADVIKLMAIIEEGLEITEDDFHYELITIPSYINSPNSDYAAMIDNEAKVVYFTSQRPNSKKKENIWKSEKIDNVWQHPVPVSSLNTDWNESLGYFDSATNSGYLFRNNMDDKDNGDIYVINMKDEFAPAEKVANINTKFPEMQPFVYKDNIMFFTSFRPTGKGGTDLYVSEKVDGVWGKPINLGDVINTDGNEQTPFLDWDGKTLYFASDGHVGLGGFDIFKSEKIGDSWEEWSEPVNLGIELNTIKDDRYYYKRENTNFIFISSNRVGGIGFDDIYCFTEEKYKTIKQREKYVTIEGYVNDEKGSPVETQIKWFYNYNDVQYQSVVNTNEIGYYSIGFDQTEGCEYMIEEEKYFIQRGIVLVQENQKNINHDIVLMKIPVDEALVLDNIYFNFNKATLQEKSFPALNSLAETLKNNPQINIEISGHTDSVGSDDYNLELSQKRAEAVVDYLASQGVSLSNLTAKGYGKIKPIASNETEEGRSKNRRVEMNVIEFN